MARNHAELEIETPKRFSRQLYHTFYFPGWRVEVDGEPVEIVPTEGNRADQLCGPGRANTPSRFVGP